MSSHNSTGIPAYLLESSGRAPLPLTKKWLALHFKCYAGGRVNTRVFYTKILSPDVIEAAGLTLEEVRHPGCKTFTVTQSLQICKMLGLAH